VEPIEVSDTRPISAEKILVLLPCRGGHWHHLVNRVKAGRIARLPPIVIAMIFARSARACGVERLVLCYLKAKRFHEEQEKDIRAIIAALENFGIETVTLRLDSMESPKNKTTTMPLEDYAVAPLAIFPGRLTKTCYSVLEGIPVGPLLVEGFDIVLEWAYKVAKEHYEDQLFTFEWHSLAL